MSFREVSCLCLPSCCRNAETSGVQRGFYTVQRAQAPALTFAQQMNFPAEPPPTAMLHNFCDRQVLQPQIDQQCCVTGFPSAAEGDNKWANAVCPRCPPPFLFLSLPHWQLWSLKLTLVATQKHFFCPHRPRWPLFSSSPNLRVSPNSFFLPDATSTRAPPRFFHPLLNAVPARKCFEI